MRKYNSSFKTAFISEAGNKLKNNDYFGFVELDKYACYVIADGITEMRDSESAVKAIEAVIRAFQNAPGIRKGRIKSYLRTANQELLEGRSYEKMKASLTVVVTDYEKIRYGYAGNTRLGMYRDGRLFLVTEDMSLSRDMVKDHELAEDKLSRHEERNNLFSYLGKNKFRPSISKKIKLRDGDIITLYTRGIWENVDEGELADVFAEAGDDPMEECDKVEDLLLSRQPEDLNNYTFAAVYVNKVFTDPERKKRRKKIIAIILVLLTAVIIVCIIIFFWRKDRKQKRESMEKSFSNVEAYMEDDNFIRASEECEKALELAEKLHDGEAEDRYHAYLMSLEAIIGADERYREGSYEEAKDAYLKAKVRIRYADNKGLEYIEKRLLQIGDYEQVFDSMEMGDSLLDHSNYELAEEKYLEAKRKAASIYFDEGKQQALDALDKLYSEWSAAKEEQEKQDALQAADEVSAAELVKQGDETYAQNDYDGAMVYYLIALEKYTKLENTAQIAFLNKKIIALNVKQEEVEARMEEAKTLEEQARIFEEEKDYEQAKLQYQYAKAVYTELGKENKANEMQGTIDIIDTKIAKEEKEQSGQAGQDAAGQDGDAGSGKTVSGNE